MTDFSAKAFSRTSRHLTRLAACAALSGAFLISTAAKHPAEAAELAGSWRGGGSVSFLSGKAERARCKASFSKLSATSYAMNATCATASGSVSQSATVRKSGGNTFRGSFYNSEYDTSGSVSLRLSGKSLSAFINATKGTASMSLSK
jgi:hypothetical protein